MVSSSSDGDTSKGATPEEEIEKIPEYKKGDKGTYPLADGSGKTVTGEVVSFFKGGNKGLMLVSPDGEKADSRICIGQDSEDSEPPHNPCG